MRLNPFRASAIHPATWWLVGLIFAACASLSNSIAGDGLLVGVAIVVMLTCREQAPWSRSIRFYLLLGAFVIAVRIGFRILFNSSSDQTDIAFSLVPITIGGVNFLGDVSWQSLESSLSDGLRLAAIIIAIGMANTLANPKRLLKSTPGALYEVATAMTVAINLAPQLIESLQRVRKARSLRGRSKGISALNSIVIPALEDTIEQSLALAASMDARGFGRRGNLTRFQVVLSRLLSLGGVLLITLSSYFLLATSFQAVAFALLLTGILAIAATIRIASRRSLRTRYRRQKPTLRDLGLVILLGAIAALGVVL